MAAGADVTVGSDLAEGIGITVGRDMTRLRQLSCPDENEKGLKESLEDRSSKGRICSMRM